ncbi:MAG: Rdx family protein [Gemmatimonadota bacterium]
MRARWPEATVDLIESKGGRFEIHRDGRPIFEKSRLKRHAAPGEVLQLLAAVDT